MHGTSSYQRDQRGVASADSLSLTVEAVPVANGDLQSTNDGGPLWLVRWALSAIGQDIFFLPWRLWSAQYKILFMCPRRPGTWAGSRAGPPFSESACVSGTYIAEELGNSARSGKN